VTIGSAKALCASTMAPGRKQQTEGAERARSGEQQIERQPDDHGGKSEKGIGRDHQDSPTRKGAGGKSRSERRAKQGGECGGRQADPEREKNDPREGSRVRSARFRRGDAG